MRWVFEKPQNSGRHTRAILHVNYEHVYNKMEYIYDELKRIRER